MIEKYPERVAWLVILGAFAIFLILCASVPLGFRYYLRHATTSQPAKLEVYLFFVIIAFGSAFTTINPSFLTIENMFDLIKSSSGMAILSIAFFVGLLAGGIDISFPAIAIAGQYVAANSLIALGVDNLLVAFLISTAWEPHWARLTRSLSVDSDCLP